MQNSSDMTSDATEVTGSLNLFNATRRRWKIVLLVFIIIFSMTVFYTHRQTPIYQTVSTIEINPPSGVGDKKFSTTETIAYLKSRALAKKVVQRLNLGWQATGSSPQLEVRIEDFVAPHSLSGVKISLTGPTEFTLSETSGRFLARGKSGELLETDSISLLLHIHNGHAGQSFNVVRQPVAHHIETFLSSLEVMSLGEDSQVLSLVMRGEDPKQISDAVNQLIEVYQASFMQESGQEVLRIDNRMAEVARNLELAEKELRDYRKLNGLSEQVPQGELLIGKATKLEQEKTGLEWQLSQIRLATDRLQEAIKNKTAFVAPRIEGTPRLSAEVTRLTALESRKQTLLVDFTEAHPKVEEVLEELMAAQRELLSLYAATGRELEQEKQRLVKNIADFDTQLNQAPEAELTKRIRARDAQAELLNFLQEKQRDIREIALRAVNTVRVIDPAIIPETPIKPDKIKNYTLGGLLALFLGFCSALLLSIIDPTFKTIDEIRSKLNLPIYGVIPMIPIFKEGSDLPVAVLSPKAPVVEAFRALRTRLHYVTEKQRHKIIMVTSTLPGEGKSTVSANLSVVLSMTGAKVLLIGCDLRRPTLHKVFREENEPGLVELLRDKQPSSVRKLKNPRFDFLPAGVIPENPSEILESKRMREFLFMARDLYDYVVIDAPPVLPVTDAEILAPLADVNLVVLEPCRVPAKAALQMVKSLQDVGANISGIVINDKTGQGFKYYGSYSYYGNRNFAGYYGESLDELQDGALESLIKKVWGKLNG